MHTIVATWWTPFNEEQLLRLLVVARCFVTLVRQMLHMLNDGMRSNDVEEPRIICDKVSGVQIGVAVCPSVPRPA